MTEVSKKTKVIIIRETLAESLLSAAISFVSLTSMISVGVYLESSAMQWVAGIIWMLWIVGRSQSLMSRSIMTIQQAKEFLSELETRQ